MINREHVDCTSNNILNYKAANIVTTVYWLDMKRDT
jgi:hypothetical protein